MALPAAAAACAARGGEWQPHPCPPFRLRFAAFLRRSKPIDGPAVACGRAQRADVACVAALLGSGVGGDAVGSVGMGARDCRRRLLGTPLPSFRSALSAFATAFGTRGPAPCAHCDISAVDAVPGPDPDDTRVLYQLSATREWIWLCVRIL